MNPINKSLFVVLLLSGLLFFSCSTTEKRSNLKTKPMRCLFFFIPDCPASRAVMSPIMDLKHKYQTYGLKVSGILSDPSPNDSILKAVLQENKVDFEIINDSSLEIAQTIGATTTPHFFLLDSLNNVLYSGLIDNYYYSFGKHRTAPTKYYLEEAIVSYLKGDPLETKFTDPIGCKINFD